MNKIMTFKNILFCFVLLPILTVNSQIKKDSSPDNFLFGRFFLGVETGFTSGIIDADKAVQNLSVRGAFEYYFANWGPHVLGVRQFIGGGNLRNNFQEPLNIDYRSDQLFFGGGIIYSFAFGKNVAPFISLGVNSATINNKKGEHITNPLNFSSELGLKISPAHGLVFSVVGNAVFGSHGTYQRLIPGNQNDVSYSAYLGISYGIKLAGNSNGVEREAEIKGLTIDPNVELSDSDNDGVADIYDHCPDTPDYLIVNANGCPLDSDKDGVPDYLDNCPDTPFNVPVDESGCMKDEDRDGVPDYLDECPSTQRGVEVDSTGCPLDTDKDGVPDYIDECPDSHPNVLVDSLGCEIVIESSFREVIRIIRFESEEIGNISTTYRTVLNKLKVIMMENSKSVWRIAGHSDSFEATDLNNNIALKRAEYVKDYFVEKGISADRFELFDMGAEYPVESNLTIAGREKNRRVVIMRIK